MPRRQLSACTSDKALGSFQPGQRTSHVECADTGLQVHSSSPWVYSPLLLMSLRFYWTLSTLQLMAHALSCHEELQRLQGA